MSHVMHDTHNLQQSRVFQRVAVCCSVLQCVTVCGFFHQGPTKVLFSHIQGSEKE